MVVGSAAVVVAIPHALHKAGHLYATFAPKIGWLQSAAAKSVHSNGSSSPLQCFAVGVVVAVDVGDVVVAVVVGVVV